jgi:hypothetical protein
MLLTFQRRPEEAPKEQRGLGGLGVGSNYVSSLALVRPRLAETRENAWVTYGDFPPRGLGSRSPMKFTESSSCERQMGAHELVRSRR